MKKGVITQPIRDILNLIFPTLCIYCGERAIHCPDDLFCIYCENQLPVTDFHEFKRNELTDKFTGRVHLAFGYSMFRFSAGHPIQRIIHSIKYKGEHRSIYLLGKKYGKILKSQSVSTEFDAIVPVPLHRRKRRQRGFNQSTFFARGISDSLGIPLSVKNLIRTRHLTSQTLKSRAERISVLQDSFKVVDPSKFRDKHLLLVDDVVTTGATLEACAIALSNTEGISLSIAALAMAI